MTINPTQLSPQTPVSPRRTSWTHSRIIALIVGLFLLLGSAGVAASTDVGATLPVLPQIGRWLLVGGLVVALGGAVLILAAVNLLPHRRRPTQSGQGVAA
ncbi:hypothetical protein EV649_5000 [Kribbella sp. VKM Ac-2569]|uniref:hypothetical protein n=1 Tax=Kribbella sp. VKM Ac-2569 TaxID=2512220 RepID=UPI00102B25C9|nr:hypothetical protein [Kribbella sp. VKM Ac-2569]RZT17458.1 hypothetical protein EV649_5000 [Kribbella sp. VKM Ac-2569]